MYRRICVHKKIIFYSVGKKTDFLSCDSRCEGPCAFPTVGRKCEIRIHHLNLIYLSSTQTDKPELLLLKSTKSSVEPFLKFTHVRFAIFHNETSCNCDEPEKLRSNLGTIIKKTFLTLPLGEVFSWLISGKDANGNKYVGKNVGNSSGIDIKFF